MLPSFGWRGFFVFLVATAASLGLAGSARAQVGYEVVGTRALGMAGAFVAVADDASAVFWNPAALVKGPIAGLTIAGDGFHFRDQNGPTVPGAARLTTQSVALGAWPVGVSFLNLQYAQVISDGNGMSRVAALKTSQAGFSVLQSLGDFVVVGATLKYLRGNAVILASGAGLAGDALRETLAITEDPSGAFDFDIGVIAGSDRLRAAVTLKNLRRPGFAFDGGKAIYLERRARFGLAAFPRDGLTLAIDVDLDTADPLVGLRRTIALGGETRLGNRLALRAGIRVERGSAGRPVGSIGGSWSFRPGLWLDGYVARSQARRHQGFGVAVRAGS